MEQAAGATCFVIIQGGESDQAAPGGIAWYDLSLFSSGPWKRDLALPDEADVRAVIAAEGLRFGRYVVRSRI
ncbi:MAG TPA: hypothetical protein VFR37_05045 [Longimicrobium sp.]|nr:hypothetical protein [Longimicrobium sp.]